MRKCKFCKERLMWYEGWFTKIHAVCKYMEEFRRFEKGFKIALKK